MQRRIVKYIERSVLFGVLVCLLSMGCNRGAEVDSGRRRIAVIPKATAHEFWQSVHAGAETAGRELGVDILWKGTQTETQRDRQVNIVQDFVTAGVDGIVLAPQDANAMVPAVNRIATAGIPLVIMDSGIHSDKYISYVATDNYQGGVEGARELARLIHQEGKVILIGNDPGGESTNAREKGFKETIRITT